MVSVEYATSLKQVASTKRSLTIWIKQFVWVLVSMIDSQKDYQQHKLLCEFIELFLSFYIKDICDCWAKFRVFSKPDQNITEEFDHGSDWTLAAGLTHASRAETMRACSQASSGGRVSNT